MLTFVRQKRQPTCTSEITYLCAYYLRVCFYAIGCVSIRYVKWSYTNVYTPCKVNSVDRLNRYYMLYYISSKNDSHGPTLEQKCFEA